MKNFQLLLIAVSCALSPLAAIAQTPVLLRTFNSPKPAAQSNFGVGMAAMGNDRVVISARNNATTATNAGIVYLFHTNGSLLTTITNPHSVSIADWNWFGNSVGVLGSERIVAGAPLDGGVYLFTTNGALVKTITNAPGLDNYYFGEVVVPFGSDRVLIGAPRSNFDPDTYNEEGAAYLFNTNGALLMIFNNPNPEI